MTWEKKEFTIELLADPKVSQLLDKLETLGETIVTIGEIIKALAELYKIYLLSSINPILAALYLLIKLIKEFIESLNQVAVHGIIMLPGLTGGLGTFYTFGELKLMYTPKVFGVEQGNRKKVERFIDGAGWKDWMEPASIESLKSKLVEQYVNHGSSIFNVQSVIQENGRSKVAVTEANRWLDAKSKQSGEGIWFCNKDELGAAFLDSFTDSEDPCRPKMDDHRMSSSLTLFFGIGGKLEAIKIDEIVDLINKVMKLIGKLMDMDSFTKAAEAEIKKMETTYKKMQGKDALEIQYEKDTKEMEERHATEIATAKGEGVMDEKTKDADGQEITKRKWMENQRKIIDKDNCLPSADAEEFEELAPQDYATPVTYYVEGVRLDSDADDEWAGSEMTVLQKSENGQLSPPKTKAEADKQKKAIDIAKKKRQTKIDTLEKTRKALEKTEKAAAAQGAKDLEAMRKRHKAEKKTLDDKFAADQKAKIANEQASKKADVKKELTLESLENSLFAGDWVSYPLLPDLMPFVEPIFAQIYAYLDGMAELIAGAVAMIDAMIALLDEKIAIVKEILAIIKLLKALISALNSLKGGAGIYCHYLPMAPGGAARLKSSIGTAWEELPAIYSEPISICGCLCFCDMGPGTELLAFVLGLKPNYNPLDYIAIWFSYIEDLMKIREVGMGIWDKLMNAIQGAMNLLNDTLAALEAILAQLKKIISITKDILKDIISVVKHPVDLQGKAAIKGKLGDNRLGALSPKEKEVQIGQLQDEIIEEDFKELSDAEVEEKSKEKVGAEYDDMTDNEKEDLKEDLKEDMKIDKFSDMSEEEMDDLLKEKLGEEAFNGLSDEEKDFVFQDILNEKMDSALDKLEMELAGSLEFKSPKAVSIIERDVDGDKEKVNVLLKELKKDILSDLTELGRDVAEKVIDKLEKVIKQMLEDTKEDSLMMQQLLKDMLHECFLKVFSYLNKQKLIDILLILIKGCLDDIPIDMLKALLPNLPDDILKDPKNIARLLNALTIDELKDLLKNFFENFENLSLDDLPKGMLLALLALLTDEELAALLDRLSDDILNKLKNLLYKNPDLLAKLLGKLSPEFLSWFFQQFPYDYIKNFFISLVNWYCENDMKFFISLISYISYSFLYTMNSYMTVYIMRSVFTRVSYRVLRTVMVRMRRIEIRYLPKDILITILQQYPSQVMRYFPTSVTRRLMNSVPQENREQISKQLSEGDLKKVLGEVLQDVDYSVLQSIFDQIPVTIIRRSMQRLRLVHYRRIIQYLSYETMTYLFSYFTQYYFYSMPIYLTQQIMISIIQCFPYTYFIDLIYHIFTSIPKDMLLKTLTMCLQQGFFDDLLGKITPEMMLKLLKELDRDTLLELFGELSKEDLLDMLKGLMPDILTPERLKELLRELAMFYLRKILKCTMIDEVDEEVIDELLKHFNMAQLIELLMKRIGDCKSKVVECIPEELLELIGSQMDIADLKDKLLNRLSDDDIRDLFKDLTDEQLKALFDSFERNILEKIDAVIVDALLDDKIPTEVMEGIIEIALDEFRIVFCEVLKQIDIRTIEIMIKLLSDEDTRELLKMVLWDNIKYIPEQIYLNFLRKFKTQELKKCFERMSEEEYKKMFGELGPESYAKIFERLNDDEETLNLLIEELTDRLEISIFEELVKAVPSPMFDTIAEENQHVVFSYIFKKMQSKISIPLLRKVFTSLTDEMRREVLDPLFFSEHYTILEEISQETLSVLFCHADKEYFHDDIITDLTKETVRVFLLSILDNTDLTLTDPIIEMLFKSLFL